MVEQSNGLLETQGKHFEEIAFYKIGRLILQNVRNALLYCTLSNPSSQPCHLLQQSFAKPTDLSIGVRPRLPFVNCFGSLEKRKCENQRASLISWHCSKDCDENHRCKDIRSTSKCLISTCLLCQSRALIGKEMSLKTWDGDIWVYVCCWSKHDTWVYKHVSWTKCYWIFSGDTSNLFSFAWGEQPSIDGRP